MKTIRKRTIVTLGAVVAGLALAGAAVAAGPPAARGQAFGYGQLMSAGGVVPAAAAQYIGISQTALAVARHDGQSLAQIAVAHGKTVDGLQKAVVAAFEVRLQAAVTAGTVTQAQAAQLRTLFAARVPTVLERTATGPLGGRGPGTGPGLGLGPCGGVNR